VGFRPSRSLAIKEPLSRNISFSSLVSAITEPFCEFFFHMVEFRLKRSLFHEFFFLSTELGL
jgi:hypothetical protein